MLLKRRHFLNMTMATAALSFAGKSELLMANPAFRIKAVAFDSFVIFDPRPIAALAEEIFPGRGAELMAMWRARQFEYTWLRTLTQSYVDFWQVTKDALVFTSNLLSLKMTPDACDRLMDAFLQLKAWPDAPSTLRALKSAGVRMSFLTNFSNSMLDANIRSAGLEGFFESHLSTDSVKAFKPDPRSYQMGIDYFKLRREEIAFAAFGGWDAVGAKRFGYPVYWCNRSQQPPEELGFSPDYIGSSSVELTKFVADSHS